MQISTFIIKKIKNLDLNSESLSDLKNPTNLNNSFKIRFIEETIYSGNLHHLPLRMLEVFLAIVDNFDWPLLHWTCNETEVVDISHKLRHVIRNFWRQGSFLGIRALR